MPRSAEREARLVNACIGASSRALRDCERCIRLKGRHSALRSQAHSRIGGDGPSAEPYLPPANAPALLLMADARILSIFTVSPLHHGFEQAAAQPPGCVPAPYRARRPTDTPLYRVVQNHRQRPSFPCVMTTGNRSASPLTPNGNYADFWSAASWLTALPGRAATNAAMIS